MRLSLSRGIGVAVTAGLLSAAPLLAAPVQTTSAQDTFVYQAMPTFNFDGNGFDKFIVLGKSLAGHDLNGLIKFDLTGVALAADEKATLNLYVSPTESTGFPGVSPTASGAATADVSLASSAWSASTVTWGSSVAAGSLVASQSINATGQWVSFDITSAVQGWLADPATNNGLLISQDAAVNNNGWVGLVFDSTTAAHQPFLQIASTPEPACLGVLAVGVLAMGRRRRG